jgi:EAL domain-containing protein (putative c-di-GMP-specific phosphodiesterase class I)
MVQAIHDLRVIGVPVFMDDFGAGYSSLGVLADLPIAGIKCDRLFLRQLPTDPRRQSLLRHVVRLARELQLNVVVEGVETPEELQCVIESGIANIQGYFFSKAMPQDEVPAWHQAYRPAEVHIQPRSVDASRPTTLPLAEADTKGFGPGLQASSA